MTRDELARTLGELGALHSPSGVEEAVDAYLTERLSAHGDPSTDTAGNIVLRIEGREPGPVRAVLAHKDEIGAMVKRVEERGRLRVGKLGGSFPWVWGEGPVDVLGRRRHRAGLLSFGARHVSKESAHREQQDSARRPLAGRLVETKLDDAALDAAGIRPARASFRPSPARRPCGLGPDGEYIAAYAIDDKGAVAGLLDLAARLRSPLHTTRARVHGPRGDRLPRRALVRAPHRRRGDRGVRGDAGGGGIRRRRRPGPGAVVADANGPLDDVLGAGSTMRPQRPASECVTLALGIRV